MFLQRQEKNRRAIEEEYRRELFNEMQERQTIKNKSRVLEKTPPKETFSLIKNIEEEQNKRQNKQKQYYAELEEQRQEAMRKKKQRMEEEKRLDRQMDEKIARQNQMLKQRHEEERRRELNKKENAQEVAKQLQENLLKQEPKKRKFQPARQEIEAPQREPSEYQLNYPHDSLDDIANLPQRSNLRQEYEPQNQIYHSRVQNQQFNFAPRKFREVGHYQQLTIERRRLDEETSSLRELNRMLGAERSYLRKGPRAGLESLKQLEKLLEDQSSNVLNDHNLMKMSSSKPRAKTSNYSNFFDL